ncbi:hypothetical protein OQJ13_13225 [Legionella sp. PATHC035]|uniref:hypothetical protein n=1 Tax=Legionella sp. PATHC035 TaxID=2992040 RepID=UPI002243BFE6|nr:hypothetical protein [Legionella sp. PATHC035]MCW8409935.1 hypothetical protein [Legionella sp. PATHC035]
MSPQEESLWQAVAEKKYDEVEKLIKKHPELVNAVDTNGRSLLRRVVLAVVPPLDLIRFIAKQPNLTFENQGSGATQTTIGAMLSTGRSNILELFAGDPRIIMEGDKLAYVTAKKNMEHAKESKRVDYTKMFQIVRDTTIRHAIATDDALLLEQLQQAGDNLAQELSDGTLPVRLITKENPAPKAKSWFQSQMGKKETSVATHADSFFSHTAEMQETKEKMAELNRGKAQAEMGLFGKTYNGALETMGKVASYFSLTN